VVPLEEVDFQAGVTTILEAMAMAKPVIVTQTEGQTDVVIDRRWSARGLHCGPRPLSLLRLLAAEAGFNAEPNGLYVPPGDPQALRTAIEYLLANPRQRHALGLAGRNLVERLCTPEHFAARLARLIQEAYDSRHEAARPSFVASMVGAHGQ